MKHNSITVGFTTLAAILFLVLAGRYGFTVVKIEDAERAVQNEAFNPVSYVDGIWDAELMPTLNAKAVELTKILSEMDVDENGTASRDNLIPVAQHYGLITVGEAHVYMVKGSGKIINANTDTSLGTIEVALDGYEGPIKVLIYVGPRIPSDETSVRDAVGFINFGDFKEQTEYGKVSSEINKRVLSQVLGNVDRNDLVGKTITFKGTFNIRTFNLVQINLEDIRIVPVEVIWGE